MLNHIVLMGRLTRDPELRRTGSGVAVALSSVWSIMEAICALVMENHPF